MARVLAVNPLAPEEAVVREAAEVLRRGGLVVLPTETVYGLGARALDESAVARVFAAKGRPANHPLIAHVAGRAQAAELAAAWPEEAETCARAFWPGPLTLVVHRRASVPSAVAGGGDSIAVRAPSHPVARAVIEALGEPVAAPSANRYQGLSPTRAAHAVKELGDSVDLVLDAGACDAGIESTVLDVRCRPARVLRPGAVDLAALRAVLPDVVGSPGRVEHVARGDARPSPGMDERHYAPRARLLLAPTSQEARRIAYGLASDGARVGILLRDGAEDVAGTTLRVRKMPAEPAEYARALYGVLHDLDDAGVDAVVVQGVPTDEAWWAVADRLARAREK
jgi:L-threonylcarbamoyladenylate synthase